MKKIVALTLISLLSIQLHASIILKSFIRGDEATSILQPQIPDIIFRQSGSSIVDTKVIVSATLTGENTEGATLSVDITLIVGCQKMTEKYSDIFCLWDTPTKLDEPNQLMPIELIAIPNV